jgi:uncharacterized coiled-coil DUF342 family protein
MEAGARHPPTMKQMIGDLLEQVTSMRKALDLIAASQEVFQERWDGIEHEIRNDVHKVAQKIDALSASIDSRSLSEQADKKRPRTTTNIFLD